MKRRLLVLALAMGLGQHAIAEAAEKVVATRICIAKNKCVGSLWPMSNVEREYGAKGRSSESEEGVRQLCFRRNGVYLRLQYNQRSASGLRRPAALDVASGAPPEGCEAVPVDVSGFDLSPIALGQSEVDVRTVFGEPDECWTHETSAHGILPGERGLVYGGSGNGFVLVVFKDGVVVRVAASVMP